MRVPMVLEITPALPVKTVPEFIAYAKANPGKLNMASSGIGTAGHVAGVLFQMMTGVKLLHVPYRGETPALNDLIAGRVQVTFNPLPASIGFLKAGKLRALAVTTTTRSQIFPNVPCVSDFVPGYEASVWYGVGAPKDTPASNHRAAQQRDQRRAGRPKDPSRALPRSAEWSCRDRRPISASSLPRRPPNGPRSSEFAGIKPQ